MSVVVNIKENQLIAAAATPLWQYDYGQTVTINNTNIPDGAVSVQFEAKCRDGVIVTAGTSSGGTVVAEIPNQLLAIPIEWNYTIMCYVFVTGEDSGTTRYTAILEVAHRGEQTDEEPTPAQQSAWDQAMADLAQYQEVIDAALDEIVIVSDEQPTSTHNKLWIDGNSEEEYEVPTIDELNEVQRQVDVLNEGGLNIKDEVIAEDIQNWLEDHPEATTTVQDHSITPVKLKMDEIETVLVSNKSTTMGVDTPLIKVISVEPTCVETDDQDNVVLNGLYRLAGADYYQTYNVLQGGCYNSTSDTFVLALVDANFIDGILVEIDRSYNVLRRSVPLAVGHANDMAYNYKTGKIYLAPGTTGTNTGKLVVIDAENLVVDEAINVGHVVWEVAYDDSSDLYYMYDGTNVVVHNSDFSKRSQMSVDFEYQGTGGTHVRQTSFVYQGEYYIQSFSENASSAAGGTAYDGIYINSFDSNGKVQSVAKYLPNDSADEIEAICVVDDVAYLFSGHGYLRISKLYLNNKALVEPQTDYFMAGKAILSGDDLDSYLIPGKYRCASSGVARSLVHTPYEYSAFTLLVSNQGSVNIRQELIGIYSHHYVRDCIFPAQSSPTWSAWKKKLVSSGVITDADDYEVPSATSTQTGGVTIPPLSKGLLTVIASFPTNVTGRRMLSINNHWRASAMPVAEDTTRITASAIIDNPSYNDLVVPIRVYQNSGNSMTVNVEYEFMAV